MNNPAKSKDAKKTRHASSSGSQMELGSQPAPGPMLKGGGREGRKVAALVLEVLAGELNPSEAAEILQVGLSRYYQMEKRALEGLIRACGTPERKGRQKSEAVRIKELERELQTQQREYRRAQALLRAAQKIGGIATAVAEMRGRKSKNGRKRRQPMARALKAAQTLCKEDEGTAPALPIKTLTATLQEGHHGAGANDQRQRIGGSSGGF